MKPKQIKYMKKALNISIWVFVFGGLVTLFSFVNKDRKQSKCNGLEIVIDHSKEDFFINEADIRNMIRNMGYNIDSQSICEIDIRSIEQMLNSKSTIKNANVYCSIAGKVTIEIEQRTPVLRVYSKTGESYYIDEEGWLMPLSDKYTKRVLIANGNIAESYALRYHTNMSSLKSFEKGEKSKCILNDLYALTSYINASDFWKAQVIQVYVNEEKEFELIPRVGNHIIVLGGIDNMEEKFNKLMVFYKKGLSKTGWNEYKTINLKYKNQVVCTKK
jgi:cell division protein FtsQ